MKKKCSQNWVIHTLSCHVMIQQKTIGIDKKQTKFVLGSGQERSITKLNPGRFSNVWRRVCCKICVVCCVYQCCDQFDVDDCCSWRRGDSSRPRRVTSRVYHWHACCCCCYWSASWAWTRTMRRRIAECSRVVAVVAVVCGDDICCLLWRVCSRIERADELPSAFCWTVAAGAAAAVVDDMNELPARGWRMRTVRKRKKRLRALSVTTLCACRRRASADLACVCDSSSWSWPSASPRCCRPSWVGCWVCLLWHILAALVPVWTCGRWR